MVNWTLYILQCKGGSLYTGITKDLEKRLKKHDQGSACRYTSPRRPVKLVYKKLFKDESSARRREIEIKQLPRTDKLKLVVQSCVVSRSFKLIT
ncbi:MAG: hypothetical protein COS99_00355 [Candidatus Omnitrophica bacterium CG07_land_8_20_14_0_80_42_15]|uniref:GIY-YIG domain-containing protein n=1 Tax=Candidatus Aquitaenariimonas noxiae TaxID=1974741 RepID=A0A2J0KYP1_9BACT|nr:MAG: hypothetical protein COS99_00355 [Candidatus Omnitrophica bacterium CG07_land_8_20_14_0_80_42_15]